jgi:hypothetical protein
MTDRTKSVIMWTIAIVVGCFFGVLVAARLGAM